MLMILSRTSPQPHHSENSITIGAFTHLLRLLHGRHPLGIFAILLTTTLDNQLNHFSILLFHRCVQCKLLVALESLLLAMYILVPVALAPLANFFCLFLHLFFFSL